VRVDSLIESRHQHSVLLPGKRYPAAAGGHVLIEQKVHR
jgi:hypothetical protein